MHRVKEFFKSITVFEYFLWGGTVLAIALSFALCGNRNYYSLAASIIGACGLIITAKGNVIGQFTSVLFSVFYGIISYYFRYYGEMITYLGMTMPIAIISIAAWLRNSYGGKKTQVKINRLSKKEYLFSVFLSCAVATAFYFILRALNTANLVWSTVSVLTSFLASYLLVRRSPYYAVAYAFNDIVLIVLWALMISENREAISMVVCFSAFLVNDIYGFVSWLLIRRKQTLDSVELRAEQEHADIQEPPQ